MSKLTIYKASAGSGKTYTLTKEYLFLLYAKPDNYRQTLAVTFTNKATAEMKNRILEKLFQIATRQSDDYVDDICKRFSLSEQQVRTRADIYLSHLLHDFSNFSVSTIDSFFQKIIRSFAREAGLDSNFKIELNSTKILQKAIDHLLMKVDLPEHKKLKEWLVLFAEQKLNLGKHWGLKTDLNKLGVELFNEIVQVNNQTIHNIYDDSNTLTNYLKEMNTIIKTFEDKIKDIGVESCNIITDSGLEFEDFFYKGNGTSKYFQKLSNLKDITPDKNKRVLTLIDEPTKWGRKDNTPSKANSIDDIYPLLNNNLKQAISIIESEHEKYITALLIKQNYFALGIINQISEEIKQICRDESLFLISDASNFLNKIIDKNDTPFIYEKIGTSIQNYMIDEFQDTSKLQWNNFKPLVSHSLSTGNKSLIVGDVKQSIYRWRNSDWSLLDSGIMYDFDHQLNNLDYNYRSNSNIIKFNNTIFSSGIAFLQNAFNSILESKTNTTDSYSEDLQHKITQAYSSAHQHIGENNTNSGGNVQVNFITKDKDLTYADNMLPRLTESIQDIRRRGFQYRDICILVRKKREGEIITKSLLSGEYSNDGKAIPVISNESLFLSSSDAVRFIVAQIKYLQNSDNQILKTEIILLKHLLEQDEETNDEEIGQYLKSTDTNNWIDTLLTQKQKPLFELVEYLINKLPNEIKISQSTFIQAFINCTNQFITDSYPDINTFIEWWNDKGITESVAIPEEQDAIKVMTIHKSKGLEFEFVFIPFCSWSLDAEVRSGTIWCKPQYEPFNQLQLLPLNYTSKLRDSIFKNEYFSELLYQYVDSINMLYVAFTRACKSLIIFSDKPGDSSLKKGISSVSDLLYFTINSSNIPDSPNSDELVTLNKFYSQEEEIFNFGDTLTSDQNKKQNDNINTEKLAPFNNRLLEDGTIGIKKNSEEYFDTDGEISNVDYGKVMHSAFEYIKTYDDIDFALDKLIFEGKLTQEEKEKLSLQLKELLSKPPISNWFKKGNIIKNENDILSPKSTVRPDRVIINDNETIIIDYKFGEKENTAYNKQVSFYMQQLKNMGYANVKAYIWYITLDKIVEVN